MIIFSTIFILLSNAVILRRDKSILFSRAAIVVLLSITSFILWSFFNCYVLYLIFFMYVAVIVLNIVINLYNLDKELYIMYESILDILSELFDNPASVDEGVGVGVLEDLEPEEDPEEEPKDTEEEPKGPESNTEDPEDDPDKDDKKRKRNENSEDDSDDDSNKPKKSKLDKGKGRADPDDIFDDDNNYGYRDYEEWDDEQSFHTDSDDDNTYLGDSLERRAELQQKLHNADPEEKERILKEMEALTQLIDTLLDDDEND